jgi:hypothetical protein
VRPSLPTEMLRLILRCLLRYSVRINRNKEKGNALRITGYGLRIVIDLMGAHSVPGALGRVNETTPMFLRKDVRISIDIDGRSVLPASSKGSR